MLHLVESKSDVRREELVIAVAVCPWPCSDICKVAFQFLAECDVINLIPGSIVW